MKLYANINWIIIIGIILIVGVIFSLHYTDYFIGNTNHKITILKRFNTKQEQSNGLMFRKIPLPENSGALFVYDKPTLLNFWMKNTFIPLDILFLDNNYKIVGIYENLQPHTLHRRSSKIKVMYAIEMNGGAVNKNKMKINDHVIE